MIRELHCYSVNLGFDYCQNGPWVRNAVVIAGTTTPWAWARWHTSERSWITSHRGESKYHDRFRFGWTAYCTWRTTPWAWAKLPGLGVLRWHYHKGVATRRSRSQRERRPEPAHGGKR